MVAAGAGGGLVSSATHAAVTRTAGTRRQERGQRRRSRERVSGVHSEGTKGSSCSPVGWRRVSATAGPQPGRDIPASACHWRLGLPPSGIRRQRVPGAPGQSAALSHSPAGSREGHAVTMSELEKGMIAIIDAFHQYSGKEGDKHKLKKSELKELINNELTHFLSEIKDQETVDKVMEALDSDGDAECDFQEFVAFIAMVTAACHEFFEHE